MDVKEKATNEKRLIDANALIAEYDRVHIGEPGKARKLMEDAPTVDAVEVVRCRDCKYHEDTNVIGFEHCCLYDLTMRHNDFCSYGKADYLIAHGVTVQENMKMSDELLKGDKHMDNYELTPNTTTLENSYDEHIIKVEITFIGDEPKSAEEIKKLLGADHVLIKSTKVFHHKRRNRRK